MPKRSRTGVRMPRRSVLGGLGGALGAAALGCGNSDTSPRGQSAAATGTGAGGSGPGTGGSGTGASGPGGAGQGGAGGAGGGSGGGGGHGGAIEPSCTGSSGMSPEELLAGVENIVVLYMENHSFDC